MSSRTGGGRERKMKEDRGRNPPSRHLWVGNISHSISEREFADRFIRFGELESLAFQPGRSYAFVNYRNDEDAFAAIESLQGFPLAGNPLRIEFTKAEKSTTGSRTEGFFSHDEQRSAARGSHFQKDSRMHYESPDTYSKSKMRDRNAEPSEVLYIGFPASLEVDETLLRKVFSPFGEISKVTVFPGRRYAFVQFRDLMSACQARETLHGNLFGNPRVHICFAKSEPSSSRRSLSPPYNRMGSSEGYIQDRTYGAMSRRDPQYIADRDFEDSEDYMFNRKGTSKSDGGSSAYERLRSTHEYHDSPREIGSKFREDRPRFPPRSSVYEEEPWGLPEENYYYRETKRLKTRSVQPERQLVGRRESADFRTNSAFDQNYEAEHLRYKQRVEQPLNLATRNGETSVLREPHDELMGSFSMPSSIPERKRYTPELNRPSLKDWNWEGVIAKGGSPICRAKCFPVGKVMDMMLPEFVDCTARTGLDMLAKHYYQSSQAWVVFFVPGSDADIGFYNEFMHYLEEKQRAAVSKLDDITTLFLVPPSDFSEKVLKVPGKLSISGVILRLEHGGSGSILHGERKDPDLLNYYGETSSSSYSDANGAFADVRNPRSADRNVQSATMDRYTESKYDQRSHQYSGLDWPPRHGSVSNTRSSHMQPVIDQNTVQEQSGFVPEQLTHLVTSSMSRQVDNNHTQKQPERYYAAAAEGEASFSHNQEEGGEETTEANPQKRLQATLQLAAALLQQIQQAKKN